MDRVDGGGRDEGRRCFPLIFLLLSSYFSLSFDFSPLSFFFLLTFQKTRMMIWRSFRMKRVRNKMKFSVKV